MVYMRNMISKGIKYIQMMMVWSVNMIKMGKKLDMIKQAINWIKISLWNN